MGEKGPRFDKPPRLFPDLRSKEARAYKGHFLTILDRYGPFSDRDTWWQAGHLAMGRLQYEWSTLELTAAQLKRRQGKGRRPSAQQVERHARRQGKNQMTYSAMQRDFKESVKSNGHALQPFDVLAELAKQEDA